MAVQQKQENRRWLTGGGRKRCILIIYNEEKSCKFNQVFPIPCVLFLLLSKCKKMFIVGSPAGTLFKISEKI